MWLWIILIKHNFIWKQWYYLRFFCLLFIEICLYEVKNVLDGKNHFLLMLIFSPNFTSFRTKMDQSLPLVPLYDSHYHLSHLYKRNPAIKGVSNFLELDSSYKEMGYFVGGVRWTQIILSACTHFLLHLKVHASCLQIKHSVMYM